MNRFKTRIFAVMTSWRVNLSKHKFIFRKHTLSPENLMTAAGEPFLPWFVSTLLSIFLIVLMMTIVAFSELATLLLTMMMTLLVILLFTMPMLIDISMNIEFDKFRNVWTFRNHVTISYDLDKLKLIHERTK